MLIPLRYFVLNFEAHGRLLLGGWVPHSLRLLLILHLNGAPRRANFILRVCLVLFHDGRVNLVDHIDIGARVIVSIRGVLVLKFDLIFLELACLYLKRHSGLPIYLRLLNELILIFVLSLVVLGALLEDDHLLGGVLGSQRDVLDMAR